MSMAADGKEPAILSRTAVAVAPAVFVLLWSTGFVGAKYGLPYAEPFTFLALRLALAGALLAGLAALTRSALPTPRRQYGRAAVAGLLLHAGYLGGVFFAIADGLPAGVAAVVVSLQPVLTAALAAQLLGERLVVLQWLGLALGVVGVVLVLAPGMASANSVGTFAPAAVVAALAALAAGTAGTLYQKRHGEDIPLLSGTAVQYAAAALMLGVAAFATETMTIRWTGEFVAALAWLVLALSLGAVLLLFGLLRRGSAAGVSSLFFLVPPATALEAYLLFGEELSPVSLVGIALTAVGVAFVLRPPRRRPSRAVA